MTASQKKALASYRRRLVEHGKARYEVRGLEADKDLVRSVARRLAAGDAAAARLRAELKEKIAGKPRSRGAILAALRGSPLVGVELQAARETGSGRGVDL